MRFLLLILFLIAPVFGGYSADLPVLPTPTAPIDPGCIQPVTTVDLSSLLQSDTARNKTQWFPKKPKEPETRKSKPDKPWVKDAVWISAAGAAVTGFVEMVFFSPHIILNNIRNPALFRNRNTYALIAGALFGLCFVFCMVLVFRYIIINPRKFWIAFLLLAFVGALLALVHFVASGYFAGPVFTVGMMLMAGFALLYLLALLFTITGKAIYKGLSKIKATRPTMYYVSLALVLLTVLISLTLLFLR